MNSRKVIADRTKGIDRRGLVSVIYFDPLNENGSNQETLLQLEHVQGALIR